MKQFETFELVFQGEVLAADYANIDLSATFTCDGTQTTVKGFYDGDGRYVIRFLPLACGVYSWQASGLFRAEGTENCVPSDHAHGPVRVVGTNFAYADGSKYIPFGTTVYALASQDDDMVAQTLETLRTAPFNKIRMCVFPKHYDYNRNEPTVYPFGNKADGSWDVSSPCIAFWHRFENILDQIHAMGIEVDLILFHPYDRWGFSMFSQADNLLYLEYLLRRLAAKPAIWWSLANEYDLTMYAKSLTDWEEIEAYVADHDPYRHMLSNHNCFCFWDHTRPNITHASVQTKALTQIPGWIARYQKPLIVDECGYEGTVPQFWGSLSAKEMVNRFWRCYASGAYCTHGETFLAEDDVLWWAKGGTLKGESPRRIAFLKEIMYELPGTMVPLLSEIEQLAAMPPEVLMQMDLPATVKLAIGSISRMDPADMLMHLTSEHTWSAHSGEDAYLWFYDIQCYGVQLLQLPETHQYRIECIDTWNMTRTVIAENASGATPVMLPGIEGIAVLAKKMA